MERASLPVFVFCRRSQPWSAAASGARHRLRADEAPSDEPHASVRKTTQNAAWRCASRRTPGRCAQIMTLPFFIVGPTAAGKSEIAAEVARRCGGEIVSADAFQIYAGLDLLTAKPESRILSAAPHHLLGVMGLHEEMNAERFRRMASSAIEDIQARGKRAFVVGGSGLYVRALSDGLSPLPASDPALRGELNELTAAELHSRLTLLDPETARTIDPQNKRRLVRALEICLLTGRPASELRRRPASRSEPAGVFLFRDRGELAECINSRVHMMFEQGVVEEVRRAGECGPTARKTLGLSQIQDLIAGRISEAECIAAIQQATRRYAKRQLTWFRGQTNFEPLNLTLHRTPQAIEWISRRARLSFAQRDD